MMSLDPTEVLSVPIQFFTVTGLWRGENWFHLPYTIYVAIIQITFTFCYTGFKCINLFFLTDANDVIRDLFISLSELSLCAKVINFLYYHNEINNLLVNVKAFKLFSDSEEDVLRKRITRFRKILVFQMTCSQIVIIFSCGAPFFAKEPVLPYLGWYPLDWYNDHTSYWIVYFYQLIGIFNEGNSSILLDLFVVYLLIVAGAHLDILAMRLTKLDSSTKKLTMEEGILDSSTKKLTMEEGIHSSTSTSSYNVLRNNIEVHKNILKFQKSIEQSFSVPCFIQFVVSGIILCITSFQIAIIKPAEDVFNLIFYITFTVLVIMEIFLPCYFGTENLFKSNFLTTAVYSSNWVTLSPSLKKTMITLMEGLTKPKVILSGKLFGLTLTTFLVICNRTYSLFAVLKNFMK